jgi:HK97 family phage portal protein
MTVVARRGGGYASSLPPQATAPFDTVTIGGGGYEGYLSTLDNRWNDYAGLWRSQPAIRTVVGFKARNIASLQLKLYERKSATEQVEIYDDTMAELLRAPAWDTTAYNFMFAMVADHAVFDRALAYRHTDMEGRLHLVRIPPVFYTVEGSLSQPQRFRFKNSGGDAWFMYPDEVVYISGYSPDTFYEGVSPIETLRLIVDEERAAQRYRTAFFKNSARLEHVITRPVDAPVMDPAAKDRFWARWNAQHNGSENAGKTALLEEGMTLVPMSATAKDSQYVETRRMNFEEVARAYYINPAMLGVQQTTGGSYADRTAIHRELYQDTLAPDLVQDSQEFTRQLLPVRGKRIYGFDIAGKLEGSFTEQNAARQQACGGPWKTVNEVRAEAGLAPVEGGDKLITPSNVVRGGGDQADPTDTSPTGAPSADESDVYGDNGSVADNG